MILLSYSHIYWPFFNHGFCSRTAPYQWSGIIKDCSRHRISVRVFSMFSETCVFPDFWAHGPWGPGPWSKAPVAHGTLHFCDFLKICFMVWDLSRSVPRVFRSPGNPLINVFHFICISTYNFPNPPFCF